MPLHRVSLVPTLRVVHSIEELMPSGLADYLPQFAGQSPPHTRRHLKDRGLFRGVGECTLFAWCGMSYAPRHSSHRLLQSLDERARQQGSSIRFGQLERTFPPFIP